MPSKVYLEWNKYFISENSLQNTCTHQAHFFCSCCQNWHAIQSHGKQWLHLECSSSLVSFSKFSAPFQVLHEQAGKDKSAGWGKVQDEQVPWRIQHVQVFDLQTCSSAFAICLSRINICPPQKEMSIKIQWDFIMGSITAVPWYKSHSFSISAF